MKEFTLRGFICERCGHKWVPVNQNQPPRVCPKCKSPYWDRPRQRQVGKPARRKVEEL